MVHSVYNCSVATLNPHRLSYFLVILAIGTCVDQRRSHQSWVGDAERYHHLSRAALCETSVIDEPSIDAINALVRLVLRMLTFGASLTTLSVLHVTLLDYVLGGEKGSDRVWVDSAGNHLSHIWKNTGF